MADSVQEIEQIPQDAPAVNVELSTYVPLQNSEGIETCSLDRAAKDVSEEKEESRVSLPGVTQAHANADVSDHECVDKSSNMKSGESPKVDLSGGTTQSSTEQELYKKTRSILNKLTPQKFQALVSQMQALPIDSETRLKGVIDLVFEKAICEPNYSDAYGEPNYSIVYANMCRCLSMFKVPSDKAPEKRVNFRAVLLTRCQREFEKGSSSDDIFKEKRQEIEAAEDSKKEELNAQLDYEECKAKRRYLGTIRFLGELFKLKMLTENVMHDCVFRLLKKPGNPEGLCCLLRIVGKELDVDKAKPRMDQYFQQMQKLVNDKKIPPRVRFMLQDVIDLRLNRWVARRHVDSPKTIDQIHKELQRERQQKDLLSLQERLARTQKTYGGGGKPGQTGGYGGAQGWGTAAGGRSKPLRSVDRSIDSTTIRLAAMQKVDKYKNRSSDISAIVRGTEGRGGLGRPPSLPTRYSREVERGNARDAAKRIADRLHLLIAVQGAASDIVIDWVSSNVAKATTRQPWFIRALMTAVCSRAIKGEKGKEHVEPNEIRERSALLQKYVEYQSDSELQALYAIQALVTKLGHPPGVLRRIFDVLYDEDIISEDAFTQWQKSKDNPDGKELALAQVVQFFKWLREAEDDS